MTNTAVPKLLGADGRELKVNGHARPQLVEAFLKDLNERRQARRAKLSYDAASDSQEYARHWANADALDADSANSFAVRRKLYHRSRYENGSNGYYNGILRTHTNMVWGTGPRLRMTTSNTDFNELVEREFNTWADEIGLWRKGWAFAHAHYQDGEGFAIAQTNMSLRNRVKIDITLVECDQVTTPNLPMERGYIDGIKFDPETLEPLWYDVLPEHPGSHTMLGLNLEPIRIPPGQMLHWFKMERPGEHRGVPAMHSSLSVGANSRRMREAVLAAHETGADFSVLLKTGTNPQATGTMNPMSTADIEKRMMVTLPDGYDAYQLKSEYPSATYSDFNRLQTAETGRPISQPVNLAMCDSSTYSFASGKLDTICYRFEIDVERSDCEREFLNRIFALWFREWRMVSPESTDMGPSHQWDWPAHPVIDAESESRATDTELKNGSTSLSDVCSRRGEDYADLLAKQATDWFGDRSDANIDKCRQINLLRNTPKEALPYVAQILGLAPVGISSGESEPSQSGSPMERAA